MKQFAQLSWSNFPSLCCSSPLFMCGAAGGRQALGLGVALDSPLTVYLFFFSEIYFRHFIYSGLLHAHPAFPLRHSIQMLLLMVLLSGMFVLCKCLFNSTSKKQWIKQIEICTISLRRSAFRVFTEYPQNLPFTIPEKARVKHLAAHFPFVLRWWEFLRFRCSRVGCSSNAYQHPGESYAVFFYLFSTATCCWFLLAAEKRTKFNLWVHVKWFC